VRPVAEWNPVSAVVDACRHLWGSPVAVGGGFPAVHPALMALISLGVVIVAAVPCCVRAYRLAVAY
jgi:hypothetical protein